MGDDAAPTTSESTAEMLKAYTQYLPDFLRSTSSQILPTERALLDASKQISPEYSQLQADIFKNVAPQLNATGEQIARSNALSSAETDRQVLAGPGKDLVRAGLETAKIADPEYYQTRALVGDQLKGLLGSFDMSGGLSPAEAAAAERGINRGNFRNGTGNNTSALNTVANAQAFGGALDAKRNNLTNAIGAATGFLGGGAKSGVDVFQQATGKPSVANQGAGQFVGNNSGIGNQAQSFGLGLLNQTGENQRSAMDINANRRDIMDRVAQGAGAIGSL